MKILEQEGRPSKKKSRAVQEILNYFAVLRFISRKRAIPEVREEDILRIHRILGQKGALDRGPFGKYRSYQVYIGNHVPPKATAVPHLIRELLQWLNGPGQQWPAPVSSAILHLRFEDIHPFGDGNGRAGRVLALWELYRRGFDTHHIFAVDEFYWENQQSYYAHLDQAQQDGDLSPWVEFCLEAILEALRSTWNRLQALPTQKDQKQVILRPKQEKLVVLLQKEPLGIQEIARLLKVTKPGAHFLLRPLLYQKIVIRKGGYKTGKYYIL